jgi:hypothetical protein
MLYGCFRERTLHLVLCVCAESEESLVLMCWGKINYFSATHERTKEEEDEGKSGIRKFYRFPNSIF